MDKYIFICKNLVQPVKSLFAHTELPLGPVTESLTNTRASTNTTRPTVGAASRLVRGREEEKKEKKSLRGGIIGMVCTVRNSRGSLPAE